MDMSTSKRKIYNLKRPLQQMIYEYIPRYNLFGMKRFFKNKPITKAYIEQRKPYQKCKFYWLKFLVVILLKNKFGIKISEDSKELDINSLGLGNDGFEHLSQCKFLSKLESLDLGTNSLTSEGIKLLQQCTFLENLKSISFRSNYIGDLLIEHLSQCKFLSKLESLDLGSNILTSEGIKLLQQCTFLENLKSISFTGNDIGDSETYRRFLRNAFPNIKIIQFN